MVADKVMKLIDKGYLPLLVVSSMKGTTDSLLKLSHEVVGENGDAELLDEILSMGERLSAQVLTLCLRARGTKAVYLDPLDEKWPIITDSDYGNAKPMIDETKRRVDKYLVPLIKQGLVVVIPGFIGKSLSGKITTMGRNTSDVSAAIIAKLLNAKALVFVKEGGGILRSLNRRSVLNRISLREVKLMIQYGVKVLHPKVLDYIEGIPKVIITSLDELDQVRGTEVVGERRGKVKVRMLRNVGLIILIGVDRIEEALRDVFDVVGKEKLMILDLVVKEDSLIAVLNHCPRDIKSVEEKLCRYARVVRTQERVSIVTIEHEVKFSRDVITRLALELSEMMERSLVYDYCIYPDSIKIYLPTSCVDAVTKGVMEVMQSG